MLNELHVEPSDFVDGWVMVREAGKQVQHFRTRDEAARYATSPSYREYVQRRYQAA